MSGFTIVMVFLFNLTIATDCHRLPLTNRYPTHTHTHTQTVTDTHTFPHHSGSGPAVDRTVERLSCQLILSLSWGACAHCVATVTAPGPDCVPTGPPHLQLQGGGTESKGHKLYVNRSELGHLRGASRLRFPLDTLVEDKPSLLLLTQL